MALHRPAPDGVLGLKEKWTPEPTSNLKLSPTEWLANEGLVFLKGIQLGKRLVRVGCTK